MSTLEGVQARHRKELKDLQARITQKKKQATKKTRKGVNDECADLERALREKQEAELAALDGAASSASATPDIPAAESEHDEPAGDGVASELQDSAVAEPAPSGDAQRPRRNRQKERLARRAAELEAEALKAEAEAATLPDWKRRERSAMVRAFREHGVEEKEIRPDGHCLYSSVADQLVQLGMGDEETEGYKAVRRRAARWIESHREDFEPFLEEPLGMYVHKIENTAEWGGHLELMALARSYNVEICVLQDGRLDKFGPGEAAGEVEKIWLAYYHHGYGLGEHYNSLRKAP